MDETIIENSEIGIQVEKLDLAKWFKSNKPTVGNKSRTSGETY